MSDSIDYSAIKRKIESETCVNHNKQPEFIKTSSGFQINSCCEEFKSKLSEKAKKLVAEEMRIYAQKMFKSAFKK
jgi:hypothetical protein